jgi:hypothetical protein
MREVKVGTIVKHLKELGIECMYLSGSYVSLYWRGEDIGNIHQSEGNPPVVHINADLVAVAGPNPDAVDIEIDREDWKDSVGAAFYHLQGSEERFVDMTRAKRVSNIRRYFNRRKMDAAIAKIPGPDELAPVNPSAGSYGGNSYDKQTFPTSPTLQRLME